MRPSTVTLLLATLQLTMVQAQTDKPTGNITEALQETVSPETDETWLDFETTQLTDSVLQGLNETEISLFGFEDTIINGNETLSSRRRSSSVCKVFPGDILWPGEAVWKLFDFVLGGALLKPEPKARVCWGKTYNAAACSAITANWTNSYSHRDDPIEVFSPEFEGMTCQPPSFQYPYITSCTQGGYPVYVVEATSVAQIQLAVNFARSTGIRLVVKNTGHDFAGKSSGAGSLSIWTHNLKEMKYYANYKDVSGYRGPAIKAGAGVQAFELYKFANANGVTVVGGEAQTVGVTGGYILGGGHSPFSSLRGMAADHVLSFEIVTPDGRFLTASSTENSDLYWALRGGGGGTFGVVTSVTLKVYPDVPCTIATFTFLTIGPITSDIFWAGVNSFIARFPEFTAAGTYGYWFIYPNFATGVGHMFIMQPFFFPNMNTTQAQALLAPWLAEMSALGIQIAPVYTTSSFYNVWQVGFPLENVMNSHATTASRLIPKDNWSSKAKLNATLQVYRETAEAGHFIIGFHITAKLQSNNTANAVNPAWRNALSHTIVVQSWGNATRPEIATIWNTFINVDMKKFRDITPGSGAYLNEADRREPNFQQAFYGSNYDRLLSIKKRYDPNDVFWVATGVGSEGWAVQSVDGLPNENGRLCRT